MLGSLIRVSLAVLIVGCAGQASADADPVRLSPSASAPIRIVLAADVDWQALNPARGDMSPRAGTLWGDRNAEVPTGFLAEFRDGFSSPPHIHNVSYRAVVISGGIHNDDPEAERMWMGSGSFWTQPKGEVHITSAQGRNNVALVETDHGPYLVRPTGEAFDSGERPINVDASNIVWVPFGHEHGEPEGVLISYLWGGHRKGQSRGVFLRFPPGFVGAIQASGEQFHAVVIQGSLKHAAGDGRILTAGSYFGAKGDSVHRVGNSSDQPVVIYIRTDNQLSIDRQQ